MRTPPAQWPIYPERHALRLWPQLMADGVCSDGSGDDGQCNTGTAAQVCVAFGSAAVSVCDFGQPGAR